MMDIKHGKYWDLSWNPLKVKGGGFHCTKCSPGCDNCWAEGMSTRFHKGLPYDDRPVEYVLDEKVLEQPLHRKEPTVYFVCDLCDLFHEQVPVELIEEIIWTMIKWRQHKYLILTKRPKRAIQFLKDHQGIAANLQDSKHIFPGLTICNQAELYKVEQFLQIPGKKWLSIEPCLGDIDLTSIRVSVPMHKGRWIYRFNSLEETHRIYDGPINVDYGKFGQVIIGGESGPKARPMHPNMARSIRDQCAAAGVPFFFKQWGVWGIAEVIKGQKQLALVGDSKPLPPNTRFKCFPEHINSTIPCTGWVCVGKTKAGRLLDGVEHNDLIWAKN